MLLVDDDPAIVKLIQHILQRQGFPPATHVASGPGAVATVSLLALCSYALGDWVVGASADDLLGRPLATLAKIALGSGIVALVVFALALTPLITPLRVFARR